jgi:hypothetical protein
MKNIMTDALIREGSSLSFSAAFPTGTFPRFVKFLSNFALRLRMDRGAGAPPCEYIKKEMQQQEDR